MKAVEESAIRPTLQAASTRRVSVYGENIRSTLHLSNPKWRTPSLARASLSRRGLPRYPIFLHTNTLSPSENPSFDPLGFQSHLRTTATTLSNTVGQRTWGVHSTKFSPGVAVDNVRFIIHDDTRRKHALSCPPIDAAALRGHCHATGSAAAHLAAEETAHEERRRRFSLYVLTAAATAAALLCFLLLSRPSLACSASSLLTSSSSPPIPPCPPSPAVTPTALQSLSSRLLVAWRAAAPTLSQVAKVVSEQGVLLTVLLAASAFFSMAETSITTLWPWKVRRR